LINIITGFGIFFDSKKTFRGSKKKNKKYAITKGMKMCWSSFNTKKITNNPITDIKNLTAGSFDAFFIV
jgi:hypothetical protein